MSRSNDVSTAMQYAKSGVDGVHLMDSHKATIGWVVNTLAAEVERLEAEHIEAMAAITAVSRAAGQERTRAETAEALLKQTEDIAAQRMQSCATMLARAEAAEARVAMADQSIEELQAALNTQVDRVSWLEQQREEECKQKEAALKESGMCLKETREFKERAFKAEARVRELEELCDAEDKRMEACDWVRQYREACIKIADMHDELEAVKTQNARLREALCDALAVMPDGPMRDAVKAALADGKAAP